MRQVSCDDTPTPRSSISSKLEAYSTKYDYLGFPEYAQQLSNAVETFLENDSGNKVSKIDVTYLPTLYWLIYTGFLIKLLGSRRLAFFGSDVAALSRCIQTRNVELSGA